MSSDKAWVKSVLVADETMREAYFPVRPLVRRAIARALNPLNKLPDSRIVWRVRRWSDATEYTGLCGPGAVAYGLIYRNNRKMEMPYDL